MSSMDVYGHQLTRLINASSPSLNVITQNVCKYNRLIIIIMMIIIIIAVAVETMGAINEAGMNFLGDLGRRITKHTDDHRESAFLFHGGRDRGEAGGPSPLQ